MSHDPNYDPVVEAHVRRMLHGRRTVATLDNLFGDNCKGKFAELIATYWAEVIARGTGGANAGHTSKVGDREIITHLLPVGVEHGTPVILGQGMAICASTLLKEIAEHEDIGIGCDKVVVSKDALVVMPYHEELDQANVSQANGGIGSTGRGIGPCYSDFRSGIAMKDLLDRDTLARKLQSAKARFPGATVDVDTLLEQYAGIGDQLRDRIRDTRAMMREFHRQGKNISLEGAQGLLLSSVYGVRPFITMSDSSLIGTAQGVGLHPDQVDFPVGVIRFPMHARVGGGPLVTEIGGHDSMRRCAQKDFYAADELDEFGIPYTVNADDSVSYDAYHRKIGEMMNSEDPFIQGIGLRLRAREFGASTQRPRRTAWSDLVALKYAMEVNGPNVVLTKLDVVRGLKEFQVCTRYKGHDEFPVDAEALFAAEPENRTYPGFYEDLSEIESLAGLPEGLRTAIADVEATGANILAGSYGPERNEIMFR